MAPPLMLGIPATLALFALSLLAARAARRESVTRQRCKPKSAAASMPKTRSRQAQKMEAVGRLTGGIAHDFNNHLTVISSNVELLKRRLPDDSRGLARLADAAMQGVRRAATLTQRLLAFSRQQTLDPEPLDAGQLVSGMLDLLRRTLGEKHRGRDGIGRRSVADAHRRQPVGKRAAQPGRQRARRDAARAAS